MMENLLALDRQLFIVLNSYHHTQLNPLMQILSGQILWMPLILFFLYHSYRQLGGQRTALFCLSLSLALIASDVSSSYIIKNIFDRLRPCREEDLKLFINFFGQKCGGKFGFVSSHAANAFALTAFSLISLKFKRRAWLLWIVPILVSYSRIYLGVHYPGDLVGGMIVGVWWGVVLGWMFNRSKVQDEI